MGTILADVWVPLAADITAVNTADSEEAPSLLCALPAEVRVILGNRHLNTPELRDMCDEDSRMLVTTHSGRHPRTDIGVEVRRISHHLRCRAIENFNEHFKGIFDGRGQDMTKGLGATRPFALGAVLVYQLTFWYRFEHGFDLNIGLKPFLKAA